VLGYTHFRGDLEESRSASPCENDGRASRNCCFERGMTNAMPVRLERPRRRSGRLILHTNRNRQGQNWNSVLDTSSREQERPEAP
jgi:hypothetical protein